MLVDPLQLVPLAKLLVENLQRGQDLRLITDQGANTLIVSRGVSPAAKLLPTRLCEHPTDANLSLNAVN